MKKKVKLVGRTQMILNFQLVNDKGEYIVKDGRKFADAPELIKMKDLGNFLVGVPELENFKKDYEII